MHRGVKLLALIVGLAIRILFTVVPRFIAILYKVSPVFIIYEVYPYIYGIRAFQVLGPTIPVLNKAKISLKIYNSIFGDVSEITIYSSIKET